MGTNNFYKENAKNYYAVLMNDYNNDDYNDYNDQYAYADFKEILNDTLKQEFKDNYYEYEKAIAFSNRHHSGSELGEIEVLNITHLENHSSQAYELIINICPVIRSGYYEGANLDFNINFEFYYEDEDKDGNIISFDNDDFIIDTTYDEKILELTKLIKHNIKHNKRLIKKMNKEFYNTIDKLEKIYSQLSTPLLKIGGFSNGEAIYQKKI